jgi:DNA-binding NtrC family response regulator
VLTVLVVDASPTIRLLLRRFLAQQGVRDRDVAEASDADEAKRQFDARAPDLVFLDARLAALGDELLRARPLTKVVMTGDERSDPHVRAMLANGAFDHVEKPVRAARVRDVVELAATEGMDVERIPLLRP